MKFEVQDHDAYQIVRCCGVLGPGMDGVISDIMHPLIDDRMSRLVVDLSGVNRITSEGINALVTLVARANTKGSRVVFANPSPFVKGVFERTRIDRFLETEISCDDAVKRLLSDDED